MGRLRPRLEFLHFRSECRLVSPRLRNTSGSVPPFPPGKGARGIGRRGNFFGFPFPASGKGTKGLGSSSTVRTADAKGQGLRRFSIREQSNPKLIRRARDMRRDPTPEEELLARIARQPARRALSPTAAGGSLYPGLLRASRASGGGS